jgi:glycosyltransferase involved in cell wall biosynthesis
MHSVYVGGIAVHVSELAKSLARKGHDVHIFTRMGHNQNHYDLIDGVHYHRCGFDLNPHFITEIENMCRSFVHHLFATEDAYGAFDIIHAHDWLAANALIWIKNGRHRKSILTMHSTEYGRCGNSFMGGHSQDINHIEWNGIYHADKVIAVSKTLRDEMNWLYSLPVQKVNVVYNGVNCRDYDGWIDALAVRRMYEIGAHDPIVLFAGRMVHQKGPDILMEAVPRVLERHPLTKFIFVGDGGMRWHLEDLAHRMGVRHATRFLGHLSGWRLMDLFKTADCVCVPSRNEPFGIVILEAWSAGKSVVASINGGPSEFVWHDINGYKIHARPDSAQWGLERSIEDLGHTHWMGFNGRKTVEMFFSWDKIADETLAIYAN